MKFDVSKWTEIPLNRVTTAPDGIIMVRASEPVSLYIIDAEGDTVLYGSGVKLKCRLDPLGQTEFLVDGPAEARVFYYNPRSVVFTGRHGMFFNPDSFGGSGGGTLNAILREVRLLKLDNMAERKRLRRQAENIRQSRVASTEPEPGVVEDEGGVDAATP